MLHGASLLVGAQRLVAFAIEIVVWCMETQGCFSFAWGEGVSFIFASYWSDAMVGGEGALWSGVDGGEIW